MSEIDIEKMKVDADYWQEVTEAIMGIKKPEAQQTQEWIDGLPPVGADQNVFVPATRISAAGSDSPRSTWKVVAHHNGHAVVCIDEFGTGQHGAHIIPASGCRPIRTPEQRERDEVVDFTAREYLSKRLESDPNLSGEQARKIAGALYDAGMLRRAEE